MTEILNSLFYLSGRLVVWGLVIIPVVFMLSMCLLYVISDFIRTVRNNRGIY